MGLFDVVTGKYLRFNNMKAEAYKHVCGVLDTYVSSRLGEYPNLEKLFFLARNSLYAYYYGSSAYIASNLDGQLSEYRNALLNLPYRSYLNLISALSFGHIATVYLTTERTENSTGWFNMLSEGFCEIYDRPDNYADSWCDKLDWISEKKETLSTRLAFKVYDDVAPILGLPANNAGNCIAWYQACIGCAELMGQIVKNPQLNELIEIELKATLKKPGHL